MHDVILPRDAALQAACDRLSDRLAAAEAERDDLAAARQHDRWRLAALEDQVPALRRDLIATTGRAEAAEAHLAAVLASTSWKLGAPLRALLTRLRRLRRPGTSPPEPPAAATPAPAPPAAAPSALELIPKLPRDMVLARRWYDPMAPEVSIVILNWNRSDLTLRCLDYVWAHTAGHRYEVIVVDNGSTEEDRAHLLDGAGLARVLPLGRNLFFGEANNIGIEAARGRCVCLLNNDAFVHENWLPPLLEWLDRAPDAGAVGPKFIYPDGRLQEAGALMNADGISHQLGKFGDAADPRFAGARAVDYISAACLLVRRKAFLDVLGFDLCWDPAYYEDVDLCLKLRLRGWRTLYCPDSVVTHVENATSAGTAARALRLGGLLEANRDKFRERWEDYLLHPDHPDHPPPELLPALHPAPPATPALPQRHLRVALFTVADLVPGGGLRTLLSVAAALRDNHEVTLVTPHPVSRIRLLTLGRELGLKLDHLERCVAGERRHFDLAFALEADGLPERLARRTVLLRAGGWLREQGLAPPARLLEAYLPGKRAMILHVGRFVAGPQGKGQDRLVAAFRTLVESAPDLPVDLHLAGALPAAPEHRAWYAGLRQAAGDLPVVFHPNATRATLDGLYQASRVYWNAAASDIALAEAMSAGCVPLAVPPDGGTAELCAATRRVLDPANRAEAEAMARAAAEAASRHDEAAFRAAVARYCAAEVMALRFCAQAEGSEPSAVGRFLP